MENLNSNDSHDEHQDQLEKNLKNMSGPNEMSENNDKYDENPDNDSGSGDEDDSKKRNKRRSKNDNDGRNYRCSICEKSYLSYPALYTHIKTKHNTNGQSTGRGRGRPKKDTGDAFNTVKSLYNPATMDYFKSPEKLGETIEIKRLIQEVFNEIYCENSIFRLNEESKNCPNVNAHPFFSKIIEAMEKTPVLDGENSKCDEIFADYIVKVARMTNENFFVKVVKFVFLFRECLNCLYKEKIGENAIDISSQQRRQYSEVTNAEDAPDISNDFITDYLETESEKFGFSKEDAIDLTQNFCQWLYDNNFTCSKLSLINNNY